MATEKRLIDAGELIRLCQLVKAENKPDKDCATALDLFIEALKRAPTVDAVEVPDKKLLKAIRLLIKQYEHSKNSDYVHSPVAHALFHTWKQVEERRTDV